MTEGDGGFRFNLEALGQLPNEGVSALEETIQREPGRLARLRDWASDFYQNEMPHPIRSYRQRRQERRGQEGEAGPGLIQRITSAYQAHAPHPINRFKQWRQDRQSAQPSEPGLYQRVTGAISSHMPNMPHPIRAYRAGRAAGQPSLVQRISSAYQAHMPHPIQRLSQWRQSRQSAQPGGRSFYERHSTGILCAEAAALILTVGGLVGYSNRHTLYEQAQQLKNATAETASENANHLRIGARHAVNAGGDFFSGVGAYLSEAGREALDVLRQTDITILPGCTPLVTYTGHGDAQVGGIAGQGVPGLDTLPAVGTVQEPILPADATAAPVAAAFEPEIAGFDPAGTTAVLGLPEGGRFEPGFSTTEHYTVAAPAVVRDLAAADAAPLGLDAGKYLVFGAGASGYADANGFQAVGVNVVKNGQIIGKGRSEVGTAVHIPLSDELKAALNEGDVGFQVMALRQIGHTDNYWIAASYANGVFDPLDAPITSDIPTDLQVGFELGDVVDSGFSDSATAAGVGAVALAGIGTAAILRRDDDETDAEEIAGRLELYQVIGAKAKDGLTRNGNYGSERTVTPAVEKYIDARNTNGALLFASDVDRLLDEFELGAKEVAALYSNARAEGRTHSQSLAIAAEQSTMPGVETRTDAYDAIKVAQELGEKVVVGKWDRNFADDAEVVQFVGSFHASKDSAGKRMYKNRDILAHVADQFGHTMSETTMRGYLRQYQA
ncbi:MAG: hypothetical protein ABH879_01350 [archaeon]